MTEDTICMEDIVLNLNALSKIFSKYIKHMQKLISPKSYKKNIHSNFKANHFKHMEVKIEVSKNIINKLDLIGIKSLNKRNKEHTFF